MRGSVRPVLSSRRALLVAFRTVTYVERITSIGFLCLNSHLKKMRPEAINSKPNQRTAGGREREKGIPKMIVKRYPNARDTEKTLSTTRETIVTALTIVDLNSTSLRVIDLSTMKMLKAKINVLTARRTHQNGRTAVP